MSGIAWNILNHALFVHLPIAAALLLPIALIAAQRPGRGIKPWWVTCRYLAWAGVLGSLPAVLSGLWTAQGQQLLSTGAWLAKGTLQHPTLFQLHQWCGLASLVLGALTLMALHRKREDHQGIGVLGLFMGLFWAGTTLVIGYSGTLLAHPPSPKPGLQEAQPVAVQPADPEVLAPLRALDYGSLVPMHLEPVRSMPHGNRWIRVWVNETGEEAYREGRALPVGSLVVMSTLEDRWGRPGHDPGPLYVMETQAGGKNSFTFYWARVPEARRNESRGAERVYWRGSDSNLQGCIACHSGGIAPLKDRSRWGVPVRKPKPEPSPEGEQGFDG